MVVKSKTGSKNTGLLQQSNIFSQERRKFHVRGKYKTSADYAGGGFRFSVRTKLIRGDPSEDLHSECTRRKQFPIQVTPEWTEFNWTFQIPQEIDTDPMCFFVYVLEGSGEIYFDDFEMFGITE